MIQPEVMHVVTPAPFGGLEEAVLMLAAGQVQAGHRVRVAALVTSDAAPGEDPSPLLERLRAVGASVDVISHRRRSYWSQLRSLKTIVERASPRLVHAHGLMPDVLSAVLAWTGERVTTVSTVHGYLGGRWKNRLFETIDRRALRRFDAVVAVSKPLADQIIRTGIPPVRVHAVPNAWRALDEPMPPAAARQALGIDSGVFSVGWVGRVSREKGLDLLAQATPDLLDLGFQVTVVGEGDDRQNVQTIAAKLGVGDRIRWAGVLPNAFRFFRAFDVLVLSSRTEGTPMTLLEAMTAGVPVVATRVGGIPDMVSSAEALLVSPEDPSALAAAIRTVYCGPQAAAARAEHARMRVTSRFSVGPWVERYDQVYEAAMSHQRTRLG